MRVALHECPQVCRRAEALRQLVATAIGVTGTLDPSQALPLVQQAMEVKGVFEKALLPLVDMRRDAAAAAFQGDMPPAVQRVLVAEGVMPSSDGGEALPVLDAARGMWREKHGSAPPEFELEAGWQQRAAEVLSALIRQQESAKQQEGTGDAEGAAMPMHAPKRRRQD